MHQLSGIVILFSVAAVYAQPPQDAKPASFDPLVVFTEHPRLFLRPARLRLLQKERERNSPRWQAFDGFVAADAPLSEPGFADALYYQISGDVRIGGEAVAWALGPGTDLRQLALVFDWCQKLLSPSEKRDLAARIRRAMAAQSADTSIPALRARVLAAVALADDDPGLPERELDNQVRSWWTRLSPALCAGQAQIAREDAFAFWEVLHAIRDSTNTDLRESCPQYFKTYPIEHLMSHYPLPFSGQENDFRIGASWKEGAPDLREAALSRVAELAMVGYDTNADESQYLQGWLMHDNFMLRDAFGAPYEFLWANPYQPGLSYTLLPRVYHNPVSGRLFVRSDWEDTSEWFGYFDGRAQLYRDGKFLAVNPGTSAGPIRFDSAILYFGASGLHFRATLEEDQEAVILTGLMPRRVYQVEIDDEEVYEEATDSGGILVLDLPHDKETGVRVRPWTPIP